MLRDVFQNHLLQLLTLTAMEPPAAFNAEFLRDEKVKVLQAVRPMRPEEVPADTVRGQYRTYRDEPGVRPGSTTATFAAVRLLVDNWRWQGVPFYLRSGKLLAAQSRLKSRCSSRTCRTSCSRSPTSGVPHANFLSVLHPAGRRDAPALRDQDAGPGHAHAARWRWTSSSARSSAQAALPEAYERLLLDALAGDASLFARADEIELSWQIIDPIQAGWDARTRRCPPAQGWRTETAPPLEFYEQGTWGPVGADRLIAQSGRHWRLGCYRSETEK